LGVAHSWKAYHIKTYGHINQNYGWLNTASVYHFTIVVEKEGQTEKGRGWRGKREQDRRGKAG